MLSCNACGRDDFQSSAGLARHFVENHEADCLQEWHACYLSHDTITQLEKVDPLQRVAQWVVEIGQHQRYFVFGSEVASSASRSVTHEEQVVADTEDPVQEEQLVACNEQPAPAPVECATPSAPPPPKSPPEDAWGHLVSLHKNGIGSLKLCAATNSYTIGRHRTCTIILPPHENVSNRHCRLFLDTTRHEPRCYIEDTSTNGTWVNGTQLKRKRPHRLMHGDCISFDRNHANSYLFRMTNAEPPQPPEISFHDQYDLGELLGSGVFGDVRLAEDRMNAQKVAVKILPRDGAGDSSTFLRDVGDAAKLLRFVSHPHITSLLNFMWDAENIYIVMEYAQGGDLFDVITECKKFPEHIARDIMLQIFGALQYLQERNITKRNLKLENILLYQPRKGAKEFFDVKVSDLLLPMVVAEPTFTETLCENPNYVAPEVLESCRAEGTKSKLNKHAADMWSCGVILYIILCGYPPFSEELGPPDLEEQILQGELKFRRPWWDSMSQASLDLITGLLTRDPSKRLTIEQALSHPWMTLKHPKRDHSKSSQSADEFPADYCWPQPTLANSADVHRVVPSLTRSRPKNPRGLTITAKRAKVATMKETVVAPAANNGAAIPVSRALFNIRRRNACVAPAAEPRQTEPAANTAQAAIKLRTKPTVSQADRSSGQEGLQRSLSKTQSTGLFTPRESPAPGDDNDNEDTADDDRGLPVQSQGSQSYHASAEAPPIASPLFLLPGDTPVTPAASSSQRPRAGKRGADGGGGSSIRDIAAILPALIPETEPCVEDTDAHTTLALKRPRTPEIVVAPSAPPPVLRRSGRIRAARKGI
ncbi:hypothetical protein HDU86_004217 [Geranomyces michiganensis]|nr:hypothetical protein HDU86_004217 [Geranomyces michiganensis]